MRVFSLKVRHIHSWVNSSLMNMTKEQISECHHVIGIGTARLTSKYSSLHFKYKVEKLLTVGKERLSFPTTYANSTFKAGVAVNCVLKFISENFKEQRTRIGKITLAG